MRYLLSIYGDETGWNDATPEQVGAIMAAYDEFGRKVKEAGVMLGGEGLQSTSAATTVRVRDGETLTTDGPFAETREILGGFNLIEAESMEEAVRIAANIPWAKTGCIEVRAVRDQETVRDQVGARKAS